MRKNLWYLWLIVIISVALRVYGLNAVPVGFHGDEASIGYNAYSLLKTGRDQNNNFLPLSIDQFGDFRPAGYHYLTVPFVAALGLTEFATRLPAALIGGLTVLPFYYLIFQLFKKRKIALTGALFLGLSPWHVALSRATSESIVALFLVISGLYWLLHFWENPKTGTLKYASVSLILSFFFYHSARLFVPLFVLFFLLLFVKQEKREVQGRRAFLRFFGLIALSSVLIIFLSRGLGRAGQVSFLKAPGEMQELRQQVSEDGGFSPFVVRALHNKVTFYVTTISRNYFEHFTQKFLFLEGGQPVRYKVPWTGVMYLVDSVMVVIGFIAIVALVAREKSRIFGLPLLWLFLAPLPAAFTFGELPSVQRALFMLPALILLSSLGIHEFIARGGKLRIFFTAAVVLIYSYQGILFFHNYFHHSFTHEPWYRNAAEKELVREIDRYVKGGKRVIMTSQNDNNLIFYLFFLRFPPREFQRMGSPRDKDNLVFDTMTFTYAHCPLEGSAEDKAVGEAGVIYVNRGECKIPLNSELLKDIAWPDGSLAFRLLRLKE